jgi:hypothetical protein
MREPWRDNVPWLARVLCDDWWLEANAEGVLLLDCLLPRVAKPS